MAASLTALEQIAEAAKAAGAPDEVLYGSGTTTSSSGTTTSSAGNGEGSRGAEGSDFAADQPDATGPRMCRCFLCGQMISAESEEDCVRHMSQCQGFANVRGWPTNPIAARGVSMT